MDLMLHRFGENDKEGAPNLVKERGGVGIERNGFSLFNHK